jgi:hypothetical protein
MDASFHKGDLLILKSWSCAVPFNYYSHSDLIVRMGIKKKGPKGDTIYGGGRTVTLDEVVRNAYVGKCSTNDTNFIGNTTIDEEDTPRLLEYLP